MLAMHVRGPVPSQSPQAILQSQPIPSFIQSQLDHPPIGPNESAAEFRSLFHELAAAVQGGHRPAAEYVMLFSGDNADISYHRT